MASASDRCVDALLVASAIMHSPYVRERRMSKRNAAQNTGQEINEASDWRQQLEADSSIRCREKMRPCALTPSTRQTSQGSVLVFISHPCKSSGLRCWCCGVPEEAQAPPVAPLPPPDGGDGGMAVAGGGGGAHLRRDPQHLLADDTLADCFNRL